MRAYSKSHRVRPPVDRSMIVFVARDIYESIAHKEERRLIAFYGRIDNKTGCLRNLTDGGEGMSNPSSSLREKLSRAHKGIPWSAVRAKTRNHSAETIAKMSESRKGHIVSEETRAKLAAQAGWKHTEEARRKMSQAKAGCIPWNKGIRKSTCRFGHSLIANKDRQYCPTCRATRKREKRMLQSTSYQVEAK